MQYRHLHKGINTSDDAAISHKNLVNLGAVTPEITFLIYKYTFVWLMAKNGLRSPFVTLAFPDALYDLNSCINGRV